MNTQFRKGVLELCVLKLLKDKDRYGYEIVSTISSNISITEGTIYPLLKRLRDSGFVTTYLVESLEGPSRKYYRLTKDGDKAFKQMLSEYKKFQKEVNSFIGV